MKTSSALALLLAGLPGTGCTPPPDASPAVPGQLRQAEGLGKDGDAMVSASGSIVNRYAILGADANRGDTSITLASDATVGLSALLPLAPDDMLLLIQMQGADIDTSNTVSYGTVTDLRSTGRFEFVGVTSVDQQNGRVALYSSCGGLKYDYQAAGIVQVIRVPQYANLTVTAAGSIVAPPWNGQVGGVVAIVAQHTATIDGVIDVSGLGFRGGQQNAINMNRLSNVGSYYYSNNQQDGANRGEGIAGYVNQYKAIGQYGRGAAANGGGGGNRVLSGGGGGSNGGDPAVWNGQGVMPLTVTGGAAAWLLDPGYDANKTTFAGGGRGGYTVSSMSVDPTTVAPGDMSWSFDFRRERGGLGGRPVPNNPASRLFLGGGGGSGDDFMGQSGVGGYGGGLVYLTADTISGGGQILANGRAGNDALTNTSGGGGGGGGGTLVVGGNQIAGVTLSARGGNGGNQAGATANASGPGGGGGGGYIATPPGHTITRLVDPGAGGTTTSIAMANFPRNGATDGAPGINTGMLNGLFGGSPFCSAADVAIKLASTPAQATHLAPIVIEITVSDLGPSPASNLEVNFTAPSGTTIGQITSQGWDCRPTGLTVKCTIDAVSPGSPSTIDITVTPALVSLELPFTATVSEQATDPDMSNNSTSLTVDNIDPQIPRSSGGGFSCDVAGGRFGQVASPAALLGLVAAAALARARRRKAAQRA